MSETGTQGTPAPAAPAATPVTPPAAPAAPAPAAQEAPTTPQVNEAEIAKFLAPRLEAARQREREAVLKELGVDDPSRAKAIIDAAKKAEDDAKSAAEKLGETNQTLAQLKAENERLTKFNEERATRMMMGLTDEQQSYVTDAIKAAGGNPESPLSRLAMIEHMAPQWAAAQASAAPAAPTAPAAATPAQGTAPATGSPPEATTSTPNHREQFATLRNVNPFAAANYGLQHITEVFPNKTD